MLYLFMYLIEEENEKKGGGQSPLTNLRMQLVFYESS
jgi:hypothetical protein